MPELPEVETIRIQLADALSGLSVEKIEAKRSRVVRGSLQPLVGKRIVRLRRFGKLLVVDCSGGTSFAVHLGMSGRLVFGKVREEWDVDYPNDRHTHVVITFTNGSKLYYHDQRTFGWMRMVPTKNVEQIPYVAKLGPEFLSNLTIQQFNNIVCSSSRPIKLVLMDQERMAGVGNIYANEALWCAKIYPNDKANTLKNGSIATLFHCLEKILRQAISWHGASDNSYRDAFGEKGEVQEHFNVYNCEGEPCPRCKSSIKKFRLGGRRTYWCLKCQPSSS